MNRPPNGEKRDIKELVLLFKEFADVTTRLQLEMSCALTASPNHKKDLEEQLRKSENDMQLRIDKAVYAFIGAMPLASMNQVNLFMMAAAMHANLTGDTTIHEVIEQVNKISLAEDYN